MTRARCQQISLQDTPYYHCMSRCVRRAFLCGEDRQSGHNYQHRRQWVIDRLTQLQSCFTIELCAYAVMSNHYHLVLCVNQRQAEKLTDKEVVTRWLHVYSAPPIINRWITAAPMSQAEAKLVNRIVSEWRERLSSISWFMKGLNEFIARRANKEDNCNGHFWASRFKSQALLDEPSLLTCMAYVDLNPIRAGIAKSIETSAFTSAQQRIKNLYGDLSRGLLLKPFTKGQGLPDSHHLPFDLPSYLQLVDQTGRSIRNDKPGFINQKIPPILQKLGLSVDLWVETLETSGATKGASVIGQRSSQVSFLAHQPDRTHLKNSSVLSSLLDRHT